MASITALVLCGGLGSRLRPAVGDTPKVLAPVAGQPFLSHVLHYLRNQDISDVVLCTGYGAQAVADYCADGAAWGVRVRYSPEVAPRGTGGAIKQAQPLIASEPFLVLNGDSLVCADLNALMSLHARQQARISLALTAVPDKARFGAVLMNAEGAIVGFSEKGEEGKGLINAGIYAMSKSVLEAIPTGRDVSLEREVFPNIVGDGLHGLVVSGPFIDIGTPASYALAQTVLAAWPGGNGA